MIDKKISDEALISILQTEGNLTYFSLLTERHEQTILKKCKSYVKDDDTAEDLCQEILIKVFLKLKDFRGEARFSTWLFAIVHNTCMDYLRKNKKSQVLKVITEKMADEVAEMIEGVDEIPEALSIQILEELLELISPEEKMLLLLKYKEKHPIKDIQQSLGLSESAVKMRLKRARTHVNELYQKLKK
ncbi:RNA polymerase sigma factor [Reichenbachiella carrageenanivorans]|uniref:RNA polymerase sigma factor n=1 Tax=Reichenbachiella carrageenanivorans TaxID=2979869 RepID=A0ABY6CUY4_9BACT|nr:RNA polymerase sigma factor [Reichenbachiella carrageenanivorans]UXX77678.1 RNA polymerase sigma factor [Reichenbachiella carrageenanivorans]